MPKILIIDDNRDFLESISDLIANRIPESVIITANNGETGIVKALLEMPDLILLDIYMPGMDGYETCRKIKADERVKHIPLVMLSAIKTEVASRVMGIEAGSDGFLTKLSDAMEITSQVNAMLRIKRTEDILRGEMDRISRELALKDDELLRMREVCDKKIEESAAQFQKTIDGLRQQKSGLDRGKDSIIVSEDSPGTILNSIHTGIIIIDEEERTIIDANPAALRIIGGTIEQVRGKGCHKFICPTEQGNCPVIDICQNVENSERCLLTLEGKTVPVIKTVVPVVLQGRRCLLESFIDNTERKKAEESLKKSESRWYALVHNAPALITLVDRERKILFVNHHLPGFSDTDVLGKNMVEFLEPPDRKEAERCLDSVFKTGLPAFYSARGKGINSETSWYENHVWPIIEKGEISVAAIYSIDITDRKHYEQRLIASLEEKEVLIKEIHHRVKNNLQVISSLLSLQMTGIRDEKDRELFNDMRNRVYTMALIHEKLYQSQDFSRIDSGVLIKDLVKQLINTYRIKKQDIKSDIYVENMSLSVDTAIPIAQIINELVSNSGKYAFPDGRSGVIQVNFSKDAKEKNILIISDNGIGFPENINFRKTETLGLKIVNSLITQINGKIELDRKNGTKFTIMF